MTPPPFPGAVRTTVQKLAAFVSDTSSALIRQQLEARVDIPPPPPDLRAEIIRRQGPPTLEIDLPLRVDGREAIVTAHFTSAREQGPDLLVRFDLIIEGAESTHGWSGIETVKTLWNLYGDTLTELGEELLATERGGGIYHKAASTALN